MEERKTWRRELGENGRCYFIAIAMVSVLYSLGRLAHLIGAPLLAGILVITHLHTIPHLA